MTLKNVIGVILVTLTLVSCQPSPDISGRLEGKEREGMWIYLIKPATLREVAASYLGNVIDSAIVYSDGRFEFHHLPPSQEAVLYELAMQVSGNAANYLQTENPIKSNYMPILWQSGESLQITANPDEFQKTFSIEQASDVNRALLDLRDVNLNAYETYLAGKSWHVEEGSQLLEKEDAILQYRTRLIEFADGIQYLMPALVALRWVSPVNDYERVPEFLVRQCNKWNKKQPDHPWVKELCEESNVAELPVLIGDVFPNLKLPMITNDTLFVLDQLGKKLTIIDLWASWCAPCRKENREVLVPIWDDYHNQGLQIIAYALESDENSWGTAAAMDGADRWLQASDLLGDVTPFMESIRVQTIPANFILDNQGVVIAKNVHGKALTDLVKSLLN